jgi:hypothetical protein
MSTFGVIVGLDEYFRFVERYGDGKRRVDVAVGAEELEYRQPLLEGREQLWPTKRGDDVEE